MTSMHAVVRELRAVKDEAHLVSAKIQSLCHERKARNDWYVETLWGAFPRPSKLSLEIADLYERKRALRNRVLSASYPSGMMGRH